MACPSRSDREVRPKTAAAVAAKMVRHLSSNHCPADGSCCEEYRCGQPEASSLPVDGKHSHGSRSFGEDCDGRGRAPNDGTNHNRDTGITSSTVVVMMGVFGNGQPEAEVVVAALVPADRQWWTDSIVHGAWTQSHRANRWRKSVQTDWNPVNKGIVAFHDHLDDHHGPKESAQLDRSLARACHPRNDSYDLVLERRCPMDPLDLGSEEVVRIMMMKSWTSLKTRSLDG